jgi:hypothetical protein
MNSPANARDRVFSAADTLYEESGRKAFPTVDAVRKRAKVNMNDASTGMREWRYAQTAPIATLPDPMPPALQQTIQQALQGMWAQAASLANETLQAAQTAWDRERLEAETLREQMASAYESQTMELESAQSDVLRLRRDAESTCAGLAAAQDQVAASNREAAAATTTAAQAHAKMVEIEKRANDLRKELDHRRADQSATSQELVAQRITLDRESPRGAIIWMCCASNAKTGMKNCATSLPNHGSRTQHCAVSCKP